MMVPNSLKRFHNDGTKQFKRFFNKKPFTHLQALFNCFYYKIIFLRIKTLNKSLKNKSFHTKIDICLPNNT